MTFRARPGGSVRQPGRMINTGSGIVLGPELLVNNDFNAGATGWTVINADGTHIATFDGATLRYQSGTTSPQLLVAQNGILTIGAQYVVTVVCSAYTSGSLQTLFGTTSALVINGVGTFTTLVNCLGGTNFNITRIGANVDITLDSVSVKRAT